MRKSEIQKACDIIYKFLILNDIPKQADVVFVAGGSTLAPVEKATELFKKGLSEKIVFIARKGTYSNPSWEDDSTAYKKVLLIWEYRRKIFSLKLWRITPWKKLVFLFLL